MIAFPGAYAFQLVLLTASIFVIYNPAYYTAVFFVKFLKKASTERWFAELFKKIKMMAPHGIAFVRTASNSIATQIFG